MDPAVGCLIGVFDMFHIGHLRLIRKAAQLVDKLVVIVVEDEAVREQKGEGRPIIPVEQRAEIVAGIAGVRAVVTSKSFDPSRAIADYEQRFGHRVSFFFRGEDQDHIPLEWVERRGIAILPLARTPGVSTSDIARRLESASHIESR
jgi:cytidyltransferase-like protein